MKHIAVKWEAPNGGKSVIVCDSWRQIEEVCEEMFATGAQRIVLEPVVEVPESPWAGLQPMPDCPPGIIFGPS